MESDLMNQGDRKQVLITLSLFILLIMTSLYGITSINRLENRIEELNQKIETQNQETSQLETIDYTPEPVINRHVIYNPINTQIIEPDWDSGWIPIEPGQTYNLTHGQGYQVMVYLLGWDYVEGCGQVIHQTNNGDCFWSDQEDSCNGLQWCCSCLDHISIHRNLEDKIWDEFRVLIWKLET